MIDRWIVVAGAVVALAGCVESDDRTAGGVRISGITLFQGPEVPLVSGTDLVLERRAPLLAGRPARVVVTVQSAAGAEPRDVAVELTLGDDATGHDRVVTERVAIDEAAQEGADVAFDLDADALRPTTTLSAEVVEVDGFESSLDAIEGVRQPERGAWALDVREAPRFRVHVVPVDLPAHDAPELDDERLERWRAALHAWLPVREVELTVADEPLESDLDFVDDAAWPLLMGDLAAWRDDADLDPDVFAYGVVGVQLPPGGGTAGIAATVAVEAPYWRVAGGLLIEGQEEIEASVVVHELGHALGRSHAPCGGPAGVDPGYPYENASIGVPGVDLRDGIRREPAQYFDFMSYCLPVFVSDYQFGALWSSLTWLEEGATARATTADPGFVVDRWPWREVTP